MAGSQTYRPPLSACYCGAIIGGILHKTDRNKSKERQTWSMTVKIHALLITSGLLFAITGAAMADDHLFNAGVANDEGQNNHAPHLTGLFSGSTASTHSHATTTNPAGHSGDLANGQGSPFAGEERGTPSSAVHSEKTGPRGNAQHPDIISRS